MNAVGLLMLEQRIENPVSPDEQNRQHDALSLAEERFRALMAASPTPLLLSRVSDGKILYANDRVEALIGMEPGSLLGRQTVEFYYDPSDRPRVIDIVQKHGYVRDFELRIRKADGTPLWVSLSVQRLEIDGQPAVATSLLDITDRLEAEAARRRYAESLEEELEIGREIQRGFFPPFIPQPDGWEIAARFSPARQVSGDFYDVFEISAGRVAFAIADICGKGVGAALFMALVRSLLRAFADRASVSPTSPGIAILTEAVTATNGYLTRVHHSAHTFASVLLAVLDPRTGMLHYINAGHLPPLVVTSNGARRALGTCGPAIGLMPNPAYEVRQTVLAPGDTLLAYTDGVTEARGPHGEFFGDDRLNALLDRAPSTAAYLLDQIEASVRDFSEGTCSDDLTLLALRRSGRNSKEF